MDSSALLLSLSNCMCRAECINSPILRWLLLLFALLFCTKRSLFCFVYFFFHQISTCICNYDLLNWVQRRENSMKCWLLFTYLLLISPPPVLIFCIYFYISFDFALSSVLHSCTFLAWKILTILFMATKMCLNGFFCRRCCCCCGCRWIHFAASIATVRFQVKLRR